MKVRGKLLILLLSVAVIPLLVSVWIQMRALEQLTDQLTDRAEIALTQRLSGEVKQTMSLAARNMTQEKDLLETGLHLLAMETRRLLMGPVPEKTHDLIRPTAAFEGPDATAPGLRRVGGAGSSSLLRVSTRVASLQRPATLATAEDTRGRLDELVPKIQDLYRRRPDLVQWMHITTTDGAHLSFPGHGGYPAHYDARDRPWYRNAISQRGIVWAAPYVDATSRALLLTVTQRVDGPDGKPLAVVAMDIPILAILAGVRDSLELAEGTETYLVDLHPRANETNGVRIIAHRAYESDDWRKVIRLGWLDGPEGGQFTALRDDMVFGRAGVRRLAYQGVDSLWAYAPIDDLNTYLLLVVPFTDLVTETRNARELVHGEIAILALWLAGLSLGLMLLVILISLLGARVITVPVRHLSSVAARLAAGDFTVRARVQSSDELGDLAHSFNDMVPKLADQLRLRRDLGLAEQVQRNLLPDQAPKQPGLEIAGRSLYCDETGGDYYDFLGPRELGPGRLAVSVGDVSGHGIPAALLMTTTRALLRAHAREASGPANLLDRVNRQLCRDASGGRFVTLFHIEAVTASDGAPVLRWTSAGHGGVFLYNPREDIFLDLQGEGVPLGIVPESTCQDQGPRVLDPGCIVVIGTDGIWESLDPQGRAFGMDRLRDEVKKNAHLSAAQLLDHIQSATQNHRNGTPQKDDATLVIIKGQDII
ncbi:SpoIIE family protein phosphatase [Magnetospira sp. QH-2]|uniref:SpoIIE family protein phosphatase n=1 Tax=Magnetospira sp. (strain QH-2) TaxID=1288970 RepID=UPI0003E811C3|nr:SpoIIE family protein phosphatase [Magnetospira sp. QH-2]CCQ72180.1 putative serine/threonine phosphatase [Magnetospira sp. QH-2]